MSARVRAAPALACLMALAGCVVGKGPEHDFQPAGVSVFVYWSAAEATDLFGHPEDVEFHAEVLAVQTDAVLLRKELAPPDLPPELGGTVFLITFRALDRGLLRLSSREARDRRRGRVLRTDLPEDLEHLSTWSRYGSSVAPDVLDALAEAYGDSAVRRIDVPGGGSPAPDPDQTEDAFLARARAAAARHQDLSSAVAAGYRRLGPDFPGMGEHWVHPGRIVSRSVNPDEPPVLTYVRIDGSPVLTGVAYAVPLGPSEAPPATPFGPGIWHDHSDTLDEEVLLLDSPSTHGHTGGDGPRLAMFHVWLWPENPAGALAQNNWSLPFARARIPAPKVLDPAAARAVSLADSGEDYYRDLILRASGADGPDREVVAGAVAGASRRVEAILEGEAAPDDAALRSLADVWRGLWSGLSADLSPDAWARLEPAARRWSAPDHSHGAEGRR